MPDVAETPWTTPHGAADTVLTLPTGLLIGFYEEVLVTDTDAFPPGAEADAWMPPGVEVRYASPRSSDYAAIVSLYGEHDLDSHDTIAQALEPIDGDLLVEPRAGRPDLQHARRPDRRRGRAAHVPDGARTIARRGGHTRADHDRLRRALSRPAASPAASPPSA
jgi:hypothetical protein